MRHWIRPHALLIGLFECGRGALLLTLLPNHLRFGVGHQMSVVGLVLSTYSFTELAAKLPSGWLVDRTGRRLPLTVGLLLSLVSVGLFMEARQTWTILAAAALGGVGGSPVWPSVVAGVAEATEARDRGGAMGAVFTGWMLGTGIGFITANFLLEVHTTAAFGFVFGCLLLSLLLVPQVTEDARTPEAGPSLRASVHETGAAASRLWPLVGGMLLQTVATGMLLPILSPYAREVLHLTPLWIGALLVAGPGLAVLFLVPLGRTIDRIGRVEVLPVSLGVGALVLFTLPLLRSPWALVPMVAILGLAYATLLPAWNALIIDLLPPHRRATVLGFAMSVEGLGIALGSAAGGVLWDAFGPSAPFHTAALVLAFVALGYLTLLPRSVARTTDRGAVALRQTSEL